MIESYLKKNVASLNRETHLRGENNKTQSLMKKSTIGVICYVCIHNI